MKEIIEVLKRIITLESKNVESMRHSLKEDERTILRLQNKSKSVEKEIEERKQLIKEYVKCISEVAQTNMKSASSIKKLMDVDTSTTQQIRLVKD
jgi:hypothetical protein